MSCMGAEQPQSGTDVLTLFREDLKQEDRIRIFKEQAELLRQDVDNLATPENVDYLNANFDITFIFNAHGSAIQAAQTLEDVVDPFITFIEAAKAPDLHKSGQFISSVNNRFDMEFNHQDPQLPTWGPQSPEQLFGYWRERGLLHKGSIISPIDVRYYSARMLDALIGDEYDQNFLNRHYSSQFFNSLAPDEMLQEARHHGELVMYSNAVRELTSTKQIIEMLVATKEHETTLAACESPEVANKLVAVTDKLRRQNGKLNTYVSYGTAHHGIIHEFIQRGIDAKRTFPGSSDAPGTLSFAGTNMDRFFNAHHFDISPEDLDTYARAYTLESLLWVPIYETSDYGLFSVDHKSEKQLYYSIQYIARQPDLLEQLPQIIEAYQMDPQVPVDILQKYGVQLRKITQ